MAGKGNDKFINPKTQVPKGLPKLGAMKDDKGKGKGPLKGVKNGDKGLFPFKKK